MQFCVTLERIALLCLPFGCFKAKAIYWCSKKSVGDHGIISLTLLVSFDFIHGQNGKISTGGR